MTKISLFTSINYVKPQSYAEATLSKLSNYFYLGGARATVVKGNEVQLENGTISWKARALKIASYVLLFPLSLTLFTINLILRSRYHFTVITPSQLNHKSHSVQPSIIFPSKAKLLSELPGLPISDKSLQRMYLVRHGESTANVYFEIDGKKVRYVSGQSLSIPLTKIGQTQILELAQKLAERFPKETKLVITSSPALRTQQTAKILFEELSKTHSNVTLTEEVYQGLNERSLGAWEGRLKDESYTEAESDWKKMSAADKFISSEVEGGESNIKVADRALAALAEIYNRYSGDTVIAVTSFNTINATTLQMNNLSSSFSTILGTDLPKLDLGNGDLILLETPKKQGFENTKVISHIKNNK